MAPTQSGIRKLFSFTVEFTRLDENQVVSYQVLVNSRDDNAEAIRKGELAFKQDFPNSDLVPFETVSDPEKLRGINDRTMNYWRNKTAFSNEVIY